MYDRFTDRARKVMQLANQEAQRFNHEYIGTEHILLGLVKEGSGVAASVLKNLDIDLHKIRLEVEKIVPSGSDRVTMGKLPQTPRMKKIIDYSIAEARDLGHNYVGTEHLLLGLLREVDGVAAQVLVNLGLKSENVREEVLNFLGCSPAGTSYPSRARAWGRWIRHLVRGSEASAGRTLVQSHSRIPALDSFGSDVTELARQCRLDPVVGRQSERDQIIQVLTRRSYPNPLLVGEPGVGKNALVRGLAQSIVNGQVPAQLRDRRLVALELALILCGARDRGQVVERVRTAVNEARRGRTSCCSSAG